MTQSATDPKPTSGSPLLAADRMLGRLARRLRLLGYDCLLVDEGYPTGLAMLAQIQAEGRWLLTASPVLIRETREARKTRTANVLLVPVEELREQVRLIVERFPLDFARLAFSRCSACNTTLEALEFAAVADRLPPLVREKRPNPVKHCPHCDRLYWPGSHTQRIAGEFQEWIGLSLPSN